MTTDSTTRAVVHFDESGEISYYSDPGVTVYIVDDRAPDDRIYQFSQYDIPAGMLDGEIGSADDESPAQARAIRAVAEMEGRSHLTVVDVEGGAQ